MVGSRIQSVDLLRSAVIINAVILHAVGLQHTLVFYLARVLSNSFSVGSVFVFISGFMASQRYLPAFQKNRCKLSLHLLRKGLVIFLTYFAFVTLFLWLAGVDVSHFVRSPVQGLFFHRLPVRVLISFSLIFVLSPIFLAFMENHRGLWLVAASLLFFCVGWWVESSFYPSHLTLMFFNVQNTKAFMYPLFPMVSTYFLGAFFAGAFEFLKGNLRWLVAGVVLAVLWQFTPSLDLFGVLLGHLRQVTVIACVIVVLEGLVSTLVRFRGVSSLFEGLGLWGRYSLVTFVFSNAVIQLEKLYVVGDGVVFSRFEHTLVAVAVISVSYFLCLMIRGGLFQKVAAGVRL